MTGPAYDRPVGRFALALLCLVVGCSSGGGLVIEVHTADPSVDRVRLYLGVGETNAADALGVPVSQTTIANSTRAQIGELTYWSRDPGNELDLDESVVNGVARFVLVRGTTQDIAALVAVGFAGDSVSGTATMFDVAIPGSHYAKYTLDLVEPDGDFETPPSVVGLGTWSANLETAAHEASCVGVLRPNQTPSAAFIVSPDDLDCDGIPNGDDCTPNVWFGESPPTIEKASCLTPVSNASCEIGGLPCRDSGPIAPATCASTHYCVPQSVCDACGTDLVCARDVTKPANGTLPSTVQCSVGLDGAGKVCQDTLMFNPVPTMTQCGAPKVGDSLHGFASQLDLTYATIDVRATSTGCGVELRLAGKTVSSSKEIGLMVTLPLHNGTGLGIPMVIQVDETQACGMASCTFDGSDVQNELVACIDRWSAPTPVANVPIGADDPTLTPDMKQLWFNRDERQIWHMDRLTTSVGFTNLRDEQLGDPVAFTGTPHVAPDGQTIYFSSNRLGATDENLFESKRISMVGWGIPTAIQGLNTNGNDEQGGATYLNGMFMAFSRGAVGGPQKLFHASFQSVWTSATPFAEFGNALTNDDRNPFVSQDGLAIYFSSNRRTGSGQELFVAKRTSASAAFGPPVWLSELGSPGDDTDPWVSPDGKTIYFASNRSGSYQLFESHR